VPLPEPGPPKQEDREQGEIREGTTSLGGGTKSGGVLRKKKISNICHFFHLKLEKKIPTERLQLCNNKCLRKEKAIPYPCFHTPRLLML
jgi:hypothetical protein